MGKRIELEYVYRRPEQKSAAITKSQNAPSLPKRAVSTKAKPCPGTGPQAEAPLAETGTGAPVGPGGHSEGGGEPKKAAAPTVVGKMSRAELEAIVAEALAEKEAKRVAKTAAQARWRKKSKKETGP